MLQEEHRNIERLIAVLKKATAQLEDGKEVDPQIFIKSGSFITQYMDQKHHAKEEKIFFTLLEKHGFSRDEEPLRNLLMEHDQARKYTRQLRHCAYKMEQEDPTAKEELIDQAHHYIRLLTHHIENEDKDLFPLADSEFSEETQKELVKRFKEYDYNFPEEPLLAKLSDLEKSL